MRAAGTQGVQGREPRCLALAPERRAVVPPVPEARPQVPEPGTWVPIAGTQVPRRPKNMREYLVSQKV